MLFAVLWMALAAVAPALFVGITALVAVLAVSANRDAKQHARR